MASSVLNPDDLICAIDIGTEKTCCVIAKPNENNHGFNIENICSIKSEGIEQSEIVNIKAIANIISKVLSNTEGSKNTKKIKNIVATANIKSCISISTTDSIELPTEEVEISDMENAISKTQLKINKELEKLEAKTKENNEQKNENELNIIANPHYLHCYPIFYNLDEKKCIENPEGLTGKNLYSTLNTIIVSKNTLTDETRAFEKANLKASKIIAAPIATGLACLNKEELNNGALVIDLGAGTTKTSLFFRNQCVYCKIFPFGQNNITQEITNKYGISIDDAERLKKEKGSAILFENYKTKEFQFNSLGDDRKENNVVINQADLCNIIVSNLNNTFTSILDDIVNKKLFYCFNSIVITGGGANLSGIEDYITNLIQATKKVHKAKMLHVTQKDIDKIFPAFTQSYMTCIGTLSYITTKLLEQEKETREKKKKGFWAKFTKFVENP